MKKSFYLFIALYLLSCSTEGDCFNLDTIVQLSVSDINGDDLLHPDTPNAFDAHGIRIIYAIPRGSQEVYYKNVGESVGFSIETSTNKRRINVLTYAPRTLFAKKKSCTIHSLHQVEYNNYGHLEVRNKKRGLLCTNYQSVAKQYVGLVGWHRKKKVS